MKITRMVKFLFRSIFLLYFQFHFFFSCPYSGPQQWGPHYQWRWTLTGWSETWQWRKLILSSDGLGHASASDRCKRSPPPLATIMVLVGIPLSTCISFFIYKSTPNWIQCSRFGSTPHISPLSSVITRPSYIPAAVSQQSSIHLTLQRTTVGRSGLRLSARCWDYTTPCFFHSALTEAAAMFSCRAAWQRCGPLARRAAYRLPLDGEFTEQLWMSVFSPQCASVMYCLLSVVTDVIGHTVLMRMSIPG